MRPMSPLAGLLVANVVALSAATTEQAEALPAAATGAALDVEDECSPERLGAESCAVNALQHRTSRRTSETSSTEEGCHDMTESDGGACWHSIQWIKNSGLASHPDWYPGLSETSSIADFQFAAYSTTHPHCPRPCSRPAPALWCKETAAPRLWQPSAAGAPVEVKVLSYNLFWWHLFKIENGRGNSAGRLIQANMHPQPFDVMGFQECEDPERVLGPVGLLGEYTVFQGDHAICMAYRTGAWRLLARGEANVAEDMRTEYYGKRGVQWMRLQHLTTGRTLFFVNHHGPLSVNSGGACGGRATAHNLLKVMVTHGQPGDLLILVGDFNANAGSRTIQSLWPHLQLAFNGNSFGGVDNIFANVPNSGVLASKIMGRGGSDHNAVTATVRAGPAPAAVPLGAEPCHTALQGEACWNEVQWAMTTGLQQHPDWYTGLSASSSRERFQQKVHEESPDKCPAPCGLGTPCHTALPGTQCWDEVQWAMTDGIIAHPEWYPGLTPSASREDFQQVVHQDAPDKCPRPCGGRTPLPVVSAATEPSAAGEIRTEGLLEPALSVRNLREARGSDGCLIEPNTKYVITGGWTEKRLGVFDPRVCCQMCEGHAGCTAWTVSDWAPEAHGALCRLHGGGAVVTKVGTDGFVSGFPHDQAVSEAVAVARVA